MNVATGGGGGIVHARPSVMSTPSPANAHSSDSALAALQRSDSAAEPVRYTGELQPDKAYYDGRLPHAVGVHHIQAYRATRSGPAQLDLPWRSGRAIRVLSDAAVSKKPAERQRRYERGPK